MTETNTTITKPTVTLPQLFVTFVKITLVSFGGGLTAWAQKILVEDRKWITKDEFLSAYLLCRILPGPNNINMSIYIGKHFRGIAGAAFAFLGLILPPLAIVSVMGYLFFTYGTLPSVDKILNGVTCAAAGLAGATAFKLGTKYFTKPVAVLFTIVSFILVGFFKWSIFPIIFILGPLNILWEWKKNKTNPETKGDTSGN